MGNVSGEYCRSQQTAEVCVYYPGKQFKSLLTQQFLAKSIQQYYKCSTVAFTAVDISGVDYNVVVLGNTHLVENEKIFSKIFGYGIKYFPRTHPADLIQQICHITAHFLFYSILHAVSFETNARIASTGQCQPSSFVNTSSSPSPNKTILPIEF